MNKQESMATEREEEEEKEGIFPDEMKEGLLLSLYGSYLYMQKVINHISFSNEIHIASIRGLSRSNQDLEAAVQVQMEAIRRYYGTLYNAMPYRPHPILQWVKYAAITLILFGAMGYTYYLYTYQPQLLMGAGKWLDENGTKLAITSLVVLAVVGFMVLRRRGKRKSPAVV